MRSSRHKCVKRALELRIMATLLVESKSNSDIIEDVIKDISGMHYVLRSPRTVHPVFQSWRTVGLLNICK
jgi:hypothetical protein